VGHHVFTSTVLSPLDEEGQLILIPEEVLETRDRKLRNMSIKEYLIKWKNISIEDATWEAEKIFQHHVLHLLEDKQSQAGSIVMSLLG
jgi:hypothetical protein